MTIDEDVITDDDLEEHFGEEDRCQILDRYRGAERHCDRPAKRLILINCSMHGFSREGVCGIHVRLLSMFRKITEAACRKCERPVTWELL